MLYKHISSFVRCIGPSVLKGKIPTAQFPHPETSVRLYQYTSPVETSHISAEFQTSGSLYCTE